MLLFDSHCHLQDTAFDQDRAVVLDRAFHVLDGLVVVGDTVESSRRAVELVSERVYAAVGIHPHHALQVDDAALEALGVLAQRCHVVAIGEIGLDFYRTRVEKKVQVAILQAQLDLASQLALPVIIHNRDAHEDLAHILEAWHVRLAGGVMHCFSGDAAFAERCLRWGFHLSFAGNVTFPKAQRLRAVASTLSWDSLLVESDAPYLTPQPLRGRRCEPAYVQHTARVLAEVRGVPTSTVAAHSTANARRLFGISKAHCCPRYTQRRVAETAEDR